MPLGVEVDLSPGHIMFDRVPAPPRKGHSSPIFGGCVLWPNGWMDQNTTWYGRRPWPRRKVTGSPSGYRDCFPDSSLLGDMESDYAHKSDLPDGGTGKTCLGV